MEYGVEENASRLHTFIGDIGPMQSGISFPRPSWVKLNHLQTSVGMTIYTMAQQNIIKQFNFKPDFRSGKW